MNRPLLACEEMFLLLTREDGSLDSRTVPRGLAVTAALLADLHERGCVSVEGEPREYLRTHPAPDTGVPVLETVRRRITDRDNPPLTSVIKQSRLVADADADVAAGLVHAGVLRHERARRWGLVPAAWPTVDGAPRAAVQGRLLRAVRGEAEPTPRDLTLVGLLRALHREQDLGVACGLGREEFDRRVEWFHASSPYARAVTKVTQEWARARAMGRGYGSGVEVP